MEHRLPVFDGDGHVLDNDAELDKYFEGDWANAKQLYRIE